MYSMWRLWENCDIFTGNTLEAQHFYYFHLLSISIHEVCSLSVSSYYALIVAEVHSFPILIPALKPYLAIPFPSKRYETFTETST